MRANDTRVSYGQRGTLPAFGQLTSKFNFESQCGPIPLNVDRRGTIFLRRVYEETNMVRSLCIFVVLLAGSGAAWSQGGTPHSAAEVRACRGDAHRLCKDVLPDEFQVASCLQDHRDRVSYACRTVLEGHGR